MSTMPPAPPAVRSQSGGNAERGFSLAEVLVALAILVVIGGALAGAVSQNAHARAETRARRLAVLVGQSALDRALAGDTSQGDDWQGLHWRVTRQPYGAVEPLAHGGLEQVSVAVVDDARQPLLTLTSIRYRP